MGQTMNSNKNSSSKNKCCQSSDAGYASPMAAFRNGPREQLLFVTCPSVDSTQPDLLATICVDPESPEYCKVISSLEMPNCGDEIHHTGWNICSSCHGQPGARARSHLVLPCLNSSRIYAVDLTDPRAPRLEKTVEAAELAQLGVSFPHTAHCLADGTIMVSTLGDTEGGERGDFVLLDGANFSLLRRWPAQDRVVPFNYDFWYQPRRGLMLSTEWGRPKSIKAGFKMSDVVKGSYGHSVHVWDWQKHEHIQTIELPSPEGLVPLEVRFLHEPTQAHAFVGTALGSAIFHFWREEPGPGPMHHELVASVPNKRVSGWAMESMPALITDIMVSMDDRFLYASCWLHGDIRQYDISDPAKPVLVGQCFVGGSIHSESGVKVLEDAELKSQPAQLHVQGRAVEGGPQMMQLSLDGRRLYVTNSLYSVWDSEFYPKMLSQGSTMLQLDVDIERGGLAVNPNFRVDFARSEQLPKGPYLAHEMRYPGGDCTSDIWL